MGGNIVEKNIKAIDMAIDGLCAVKIPYVDFDFTVMPKKSFFELVYCTTE